MSDLLGDTRDNDEYPTEQVCRNCKNRFVSGAKRPRCKKCGKTAMFKMYVIAGKERLV